VTELLRYWRWMQTLPKEEQAQYMETLINTMVVEMANLERRISELRKL
jgi:hypothetical protein